MKNFSLKKDISSIIALKKLIEVHISDTNNFIVGYLIDFNIDCIVISLIEPNLSFDGIYCYKINELSCIKEESIYLKEVSKKITDNSIYEKGQKYLQNITDFTFNGIIENCEHKGEIVEIAYENGKEFYGKIVAHDKKVLILDEYRAGISERYAKTYLIIDKITRISIGSGWLNTITDSIQI